MSDRSNYHLRIEIVEPWPHHLQDHALPISEVTELMNELKAKYPQLRITMGGGLGSELTDYQAWIQEQLEVAGCGEELIKGVFEHARVLYGVVPFAYGPDEDPLNYDAHPADEVRRLGLADA